MVLTLHPLPLLPLRLLLLLLLLSSFFELLPRLLPVLAIHEVHHTIVGGSLWLWRLRFACFANGLCCRICCPAGTALQ